MAFSVGEMPFFTSDGVEAFDDFLGYMLLEKLFIADGDLLLTKSSLRVFDRMITKQAWKGKACVS